MLNKIIKNKKLKNQKNIVTDLNNSFEKKKPYLSLFHVNWEEPFLQNRRKKNQQKRKMKCNNCVVGVFRESAMNGIDTCHRHDSDTK